MARPAARRDRKRCDGGPFREALKESSIVHIASHGVPDTEPDVLSIRLFGRPRAASATGTTGGRDMRCSRWRSQSSGVPQGARRRSAHRGLPATRGDDYATLAQAFLFAGAQNVVGRFGESMIGAARFAAKLQATPRRAGRVGARELAALAHG